MKLKAEFPGHETPFEGDRTLLVKNLPQGAQVQRVQVSLMPVAAQGRSIFQEELVFDGDQEAFGTTKTPGVGSVEVDFHTRRKLVSVRGVNLTGSELLVDLGGGVFMEINERGAIASPDDGVGPYQLQVDGVLPGLTVNKLRLSDSSANPPLLDVTQITVHTVPTQVSLRLGQQPPFWTHVGEMTTAQTSREFAEFLQVYLDEEAEVVGGYYQVPLILHSDALTRLDVELEIEYLLQESAQPVGVAEVSLPYNHDGLPQTDQEMLQVTIPAGAEVQSASVQLLGTFDDSRVVFGSIGPVALEAGVPITPERGQAQPILLSKDISATAIDLLLSSTSRSASLDINLLGDVDGRPFHEPLLSEPVKLELDRDFAEIPTWVSVALPTEFQFNQGTRYWLVIQNSEGEAVWHAVRAAPEDLGLHHSTSGGLSWRLTQAEGVEDPLMGQFRLRHTPEGYQMPLEVSVGEGDEALSVSLDRFQPLGRIDFTIDFPEFSDTINQAARQTEGTRCPLGEQLKNGVFEEWRVVDERIGAAQEVSIPSARTVTIAPDGSWAFVAQDENTSRFISLPTNAVGESLSIAPASSRHVVISRDSRRIYLVSQSYTAMNQLHVVNVELRQIIGVPFVLNDVVHSMAIALDGRQLYLGLVSAESQEASILAIDTTVLEELLSRGGTFDFQTLLMSGDFVTLPPPPQFQGGLSPVGLEISPDGRVLFVAARSETGQGIVYKMDASSLVFLTEIPISVGPEPRDLAFTPSGQRLLVANGANDSLSVLDVGSGLVVRSIRLENPLDETSLMPSVVVVSPDGRRAFIANQGNQSLSVLDLASLKVTDTVPIGQVDAALIDIDVTPQGERLYAALGNPYNTPPMVFLPLGRQQPIDWTLTTGFVLPFQYTGLYQLTALLGPLTEADFAARPSRPSALSQVVPATGGCTYEFSFWGIAEDFESVAELIWRGDDCSLERVDQIPIQVRETKAEVRESGFSSARTVNTVRRDLPELLLHQVRLDAPQGASQVEIRFLIPAEKKAIVDMASFQAVSDPVVNSNLQQVQDGELVGWQLSPADAVGVLLVPTEASVQISNSGMETFYLLQVFPVTAGQPFALTFTGHIFAQLSASGVTRVELHWMDEDGNLTGGTNYLPIDPVEQAFRLMDTIPDDASQAELRLGIPPGVTLQVERISFLPVEMVTVPVRFLAQAPGELTITDFRVSYDQVESALAPMPEKGLCGPTPPGRAVAGKKGCACPHLCAECASVPTVEPSAPSPPRAQTVSGVQVSAPVRRAVLAFEATPATTVTALPVSESAVIRPVESDIAASLPETEAEWVALAGSLAAENIPLRRINGIGERREAALRNMAITNLTTLAAAEVKTIAALPGVSESMANNILAEAKTILEQPEALSAPLVSCIMPTYNRRMFVPQAIQYFLRQDYPHRELIILDDGDDRIEDLVPDDDRIRYVVFSKKQSISAKRNRGCQEAKGSVIACWDDDQWIASRRLSYQVAALLQRGADVCGLENMLHLDVRLQEAWYSVRPPGDRPWMTGGTLCFRKSYWEGNPFPNIQPGGDILFLRKKSLATILPLQSIDWLVDIVHGTNISPKDPKSPLWRPYPIEKIQELFGPDWDFYAKLKLVS